MEGGQGSVNRGNLRSVIPCSPHSFDISFSELRIQFFVLVCSVLFVSLPFDQPTTGKRSAGILATVRILQRTAVGLWLRRKHHELERIRGIRQALRDHRGGPAVTSPSHPGGGGGHLDNRPVASIPSVPDLQAEFWGSPPTLLLMLFVVVTIPTTLTAVCYVVPHLLFVSWFGTRFFLHLVAFLFVDFWLCILMKRGILQLQPTEFSNPGQSRSCFHVMRTSINWSSSSYCAHLAVCPPLSIRRVVIVFVLP